MVLAKPITRDNGMVLMAEGTELNRSGLDRLHRLGIGHLVVEGEPVDLSDDSTGLSCAKRLERLGYLFRGYEDDAWMLTVKAFFEAYFRKRGIQRGEIDSDKFEKGC